MEHVQINRIQTKKLLRFYIMADRIMNGFPVKRTIREIVLPSPNVKIIKFMLYMRKASYYKNIRTPNLLERLKGIWYSYLYQNLSLRLNFSIGRDVFGYGLVIPHYGTIVVNGGCRAGNFCVLHTSTCIGGDNKVIGNALYLASGAKIMGDLSLGDGVTVASNSLVNNSVGDNVLLAGLPAIIKRQHYPYWFVRDGEKYIQRVKAVEYLKMKMNV